MGGGRGDQFQKSKAMQLLFTFIFPYGTWYYVTQRWYFSSLSSSCPHHVHLRPMIISLRFHFICTCKILHIYIHKKKRKHRVYLLRLTEFDSIWQSSVLSTLLKMKTYFVFFSNVYYIWLKCVPLNSISQEPEAARSLHSLFQVSQNCTVRLCLKRNYDIYLFTFLGEGLGSQKCAMA